jgi:hypothetical protein
MRRPCAAAAISNGCHGRTAGQQVAEGDGMRERALWNGFATWVLLLITSGCGPSPALPPDAGPAAWSPNDVSILYPLPKPGEQDLLLAMTTTHRGQPKTLLPEAVYRQISTQTRPLIETDRRDLYPLLRVVSIRLDPCVPDASRPSGCAQLIRLSVQPLSPSADGSAYVALDGSIHLFYDVSATELARVAAAVRRLRAGRAASAALGVHPLLRTEGLDGSFAAGLRDALLDVVDETRLVRYTFMNLLRSGVNWEFWLLDRQGDGTFAPQPIPSDDAYPAGTLPEEKLADGFSYFGPRGVTQDRNPVPRLEPWFPNPVLNTEQTLALSAADYHAMIDVLRTVENPKLRTTRQVRCGACHVANATIEVSARERGLAAPLTTASTYARTIAVDTVEIDKLNMHAFSYFGTAPTVSSRAANDTDLSLRTLVDPQWLEGVPAEARAELAGP